MGMDERRDGQGSKEQAAKEEQEERGRLREQRAERLSLERQLRKACAEGRLEEVDEMLHSASVAAANDSGSTPLHEAAFEGHLEICKLLLEHGAEASELDKWGASALHHAAGRGHEEVVELLMANQADVNAMNYNRQMPLDLAQAKGHRRIAEALADEAMRRYQENTRKSRRKCFACSATSGLCMSVLTLGLYLGGYVGQDRAWLEEAHANSL